MTPRPVVIIGCGDGKLDHPAPAADLYTGQHFRACLAAARAVAAPADIRILSARYGLLPLADVIAPYDLRMGEPGSVVPRLVAAQARIQGIAGRPVVALCSARYVACLRFAGMAVAAPLAHQGIGCQRATLARLRRGDRYPCGCLPNSAEVHRDGCPLGVAS